MDSSNCPPADPVDATLRDEILAFIARTDRDRGETAARVLKDVSGPDENGVVTIVTETIRGDDGEVLVELEPVVRLADGHLVDAEDAWRDQAGTWRPAATSDVAPA